MLLQALNTSCCLDQETGRVRKVWSGRQTDKKVYQLSLAVRKNAPKLSGLEQEPLITPDLGLGNWGKFSWVGVSSLLPVVLAG